MSSIVEVNNNRSVNDEKERRRLTKVIYSSIKKILIENDCKFDSSSIPKIFTIIIIIILRSL